MKKAPWKGDKKCSKQSLCTPSKTETYQATKNHTGATEQICMTTWLKKLGSSLGDPILPDKLSELEFMCSSHPENFHD